MKREAYAPTRRRRNALLLFAAAAAFVLAQDSEAQAPAVQKISRGVSAYTLGKCDAVEFSNASYPFDAIGLQIYDIADGYPLLPTYRVKLSLRHGDNTDSFYEDAVVGSAFDRFMNYFGLMVQFLPSTDDPLARVKVYSNCASFYQECAALAFPEELSGCRISSWSCTFPSDIVLENEMITLIAPGKYKSAAQYYFGTYTSCFRGVADVLGIPFPFKRIHHMVVASDHFQLFNRHGVTVHEMPEKNLAVYDDLASSGTDPYFGYYQQHNTCPVTNLYQGASAHEITHVFTEGFPYGKLDDLGEGLATVVEEEIADATPYGGTDSAMICTDAGYRRSQRERVKPYVRPSSDNFIKGGYETAICFWRLLYQQDHGKFKELMSLLDAHRFSHHFNLRQAIETVFHMDLAPMMGKMGMSDVDLIEEKEPSIECGQKK